MGADSYPARCRLRRLAFAAALWLACGVAAAEVLDDARALIADGRAAEAYALLAPLETRRAGDPRYDLLLGIAALDSGRPGLAIFALERAVAVDPANPQARAELARAHFRVRDDRLAREEFEKARELATSDPVRETIDKYLSALDLRFESQAPWQWSAHFELGVGFDSNANSATSGRIVAIPVLGNLPVTLSAGGVEQSSAFLLGELGGSVSYRLQPGLHAFAGGSALLRNYTAGRAESFDSGAYDGFAGLSISDGPDVLTATLQRQVYRVDNAAFRNLSGLSVQWRRTLDPRNQVTVFGQFSNISYHPARQQARDVRQALAGAGWAHAFGGDAAPTVFVSAYVARERPRRDGFAHFGRTYYGARVGGQYTLREDLDLVAGLRVESSEYGGTDPLFLVTRDDDLVELSVGLAWAPERNVTVKPELRWVRNRSDVPINDFSRVVGQMTVRYDFR